MELYKKKKIYFPNLNGLRFLAALLVMIHHIEQIKSFFGMRNYYDIPFIHIVGKLGVILFFVLSGFLITYLLLEEKSATKTISVRHFYLRRIYRIWPLYYFLVIMGFFVLVNIRFFDMGELTINAVGNLEFKILLFLLFLPNIASVLFPPFPYISQTWSVGVEEQFYFIWPNLVKRFTNILYMLIGVIVFYIFVKFILVIINGFLFQITTLIGFWSSFSIDCMAIRGLGAYLLFNKKNNILLILFNKKTQIITYLITLSMIIAGVKIPYIHYEVYATLFIIIILNLAGNQKTIITFENSIINYLGKISYGLYMYHVLSIVIVLKILENLAISNNLFIYFYTIILSIMISSLSYELMEKRFIKRKIKYSNILSGDLVKSNSENEIKTLRQF